MLSFCEYLELLVLLMKIARHRLIVGHLRQLFLYINKNSVVSVVFVVSRLYRPRHVWVLLRQHLQFRVVSPGINVVSLPAGLKTHVRPVVSKWLNVVSMLSQKLK